MIKESTEKIMILFLNTKYEINIEDHSGKTVPKRLMVVFNGWVVLLLSSNFFATTLCLRRVGIWAGEQAFHTVSHRYFQMSELL